jgi:DNA invertase Pin-like site-specific DNA recombinase
MILRAGLYERVSTDEQAKFGYSIKAQIDALEQYCIDNKIKIVEHYTDDGVSGGKAAFKRPAMSKLLEDVQTGKIDIILFTRLDRWFRNVPEYFKVQEILDKHGVQWKAIWEDYDTTTSNGRMAITIFLAIAQNEREKGSDRVKSVFDNKIKNKEAIVNDRSMFFGYTKKKDENGIPRLVKNPDLQDALDEFWELAIKYQNPSKAGKTVNMKYGLDRDIIHWQRLARNEIYTGTYKGVEGYCEPYVSREDWTAFMNRPKIKQTQRGRVFLFTGMMKCPVCGRRLVSAFTSRVRKDGTRTESFQYRCHKYQGTCTFHRCVGEKKLEAYLLDNLEKLLEGEIARVKLEQAKPKKKKKTDVAKLREQLRRVNVAYIAGNMPDDEYIQNTKELNEQIKKAEELERIDPANKDTEQLRQVLEMDFRSIYEDLDQEDKRRFWRNIIQEIQVDENAVVKSVIFF